jgi:hypothetical protein
VLEPQRSTWASVLCLPQGNFFINFEAGCTATAECSRQSFSYFCLFGKASIFNPCLHGGGLNPRP